jgi:hypothetical protein
MNDCMKVSRAHADADNSKIKPRESRSRRSIQSRRHSARPSYPRAHNLRTSSARNAVMHVRGEFGALANEHEHTRASIDGALQLLKPEANGANIIALLDVVPEIERLVGKSLGLRRKVLALSQELNLVIDGRSAARSTSEGEERAVDPLASDIAALYRQLLDLCRCATSEPVNRIGLSR